jgi:acyl-CoA reductase-like NAD-dependent aldehyde dehydrogenase
MPMPSETMLIGGEWVQAAAGRTLEVRNPATDEVVARVPDAGRKTSIAPCARHEARSRAAGADATAQQRGRVLFRIADAVRARRAELAELETLKLRQAHRRGGDRHRRRRHLLRVLRGPGHEDPRRGAARPRRRALAGPQGADGRGRADHPLETTRCSMAAWEDRAALCAGCTSVIKPAEQTPLTLLRLARCLRRLRRAPREW